MPKDAVSVCADQIVDAIYWIWRAHEPPRPAIDPACTCAACEEQLRDWIAECRYCDACVCLYLAGSWWPEHPRYVQGLLVQVALAPASPYVLTHDDPALVFTGGTYFAAAGEPDGMDRCIRVWRYLPGPWVSHLLTVAERAQPIYRQRAIPNPQKGAEA